MKGVGGVRKSEHQSWLAKGLGLLCWGFKGVQLNYMVSLQYPTQRQNSQLPITKYTLNNAFIHLAIKTIYVSTKDWLKNLIENYQIND